MPEKQYKIYILIILLNWQFQTRKGSVPATLCNPKLMQVETHSTPNYLSHAIRLVYICTMLLHVFKILFLSVFSYGTKKHNVRSKQRIKNK
jgi:hypothetical protein